MNVITKHYLNARVMINPKDKADSLYPYYIYDYEVKDNILILHGKDVPYNNYLTLQDILPYLLENYTIQDEFGNNLYSYEYVDDWDFYGDGEDIFVFYTTPHRYFRDDSIRFGSWVKGNYSEWEKTL